MYQKNLWNRAARVRRNRQSCWTLSLTLTVALAVGLWADGDDKIEGFTDTPLLPGSPWHVHDPGRPQPPIVTPGATFSHLAPPPSDAEILFDGHGLGKWQSAQGGDAAWPNNEEFLQTMVGSGGIRTRGTWADFQLHVEWSAPVPPVGHGQERGNSGILINNMYEVQVLDCYNNKTYPDGQTGAIYGQQPPQVNVCKPPGEWNTYDIIFETPRWNDEGVLTKKAVITVLHNGVLIQNHYELIGMTDGINGDVPWRSLSKYPGKQPAAVFIQLQDHKNAVRFRNIWIRPLPVPTDAPATPAAPAN